MAARRSSRTRRSRPERYGRKAGNLVRRFLIAGGLLFALDPAAALAQTEYFNTGEARPVQIEDAYAEGTTTDKTSTTALLHLAQTATATLIEFLAFIARR